MNFFVSTGHTLYYEYANPDGTAFNTLEATTDGAPQAAKRYLRNWTAMNGWAYRSWWARAAGDTPGTAKTSPGGGSACYVRGQSVWYRFTVSTTRSVALTGISGGDADLYVYNSTLSTIIGKSKNAGSSSESVVISAGTYYARVYVYYDNGGCVGYTISW
jgi:hypothetical protein